MPFLLKLIGLEQLLDYERDRNKLLERQTIAIEAAGESLAEISNNTAAVAEAGERTADALETIAGALPQDGGISAGIQLGPEIPDPADQGGTSMLQIISIIRDNKMRLLKLTLPLTSEGGNPINGDDGQPWPATGWTAESDNAEVLKITPNDGSGGEGFPTDPAEFGGFFLRGGKQGQSTGKAKIPMPDGSVVEIPILHTTALGGVGAAAFVLGDEQDDPQPTA